MFLADNPEGWPSWLWLTSELHCASQQNCSVEVRSGSGQLLLRFLGRLHDDALSPGSNRRRPRNLNNGREQVQQVVCRFRLLARGTAAAAELENAGQVPRPRTRE